MQFVNGVASGALRTGGLRGGTGLELGQGDKPEPRVPRVEDQEVVAHHTEAQSGPLFETGRVELWSGVGKRPFLGVEKEAERPGGGGTGFKE